MTKRLFLKFPFLLAASGLAIAIAPGAKATTISGGFNIDNAFFAYISTDNSVLGTLVASGNNWGQTFTFSNFALTAGQTYYLQIEAVNYGGPGAFLGQFSLSGGGFQFSNGTQSLLTETADWSAIYNNTNSNPDSPQPWVAPTASAVNIGPNGMAPWGNITAVSVNSVWIDAATNGLDSCRSGDCYGRFFDDDHSRPVPASAPEPGTVGLLFGGLAGIYLKRKRRGGENSMRA